MCECCYEGSSGEGGRTSRKVAPTLPTNRRGGTGGGFAGNEASTMSGAVVLTENGGCVKVDTKAIQGKVEEGPEKWHRLCQQT